MNACNHQHTKPGMRHTNIYSERYICTSMSFFPMILIERRKLKDPINPSKFLFKFHTQ